MKITYQNKSAEVALALLVLATYLLYLPGLQGGFLFDDFPNLNAMGAMGGIVNWETFHAFVFSGWSGPTGRPISLASFLLDDNTWPSYAPWFKQTNILIHLLCGLLVCWAVLLLARNFKSVSEQQAQWIAVLACALWMLHPYMVSTTLYVVQRMAQLATLFSLGGIVLYLHARLSLQKTPKRAYFWMTFAIGLFTVLATYSKENGALLPLLILCIEFCLPKDGKPAWQWRAIFLWLPSLALGYKLATYINLSENPWPNRNFNMIERLLTEARIVCEYLFHLFVPRIEGNGLYQDGYVISRSLWQPVTTVPAIAFLSGLLGFAFWVRRKAPVVALAVLFFFAAHLMESTVIGLELYFEHRNYQAALFLFLPLAWYSVILAPRYKLLPVVTVLVLGILTSMTWLRASLWADNDRLELHWVQSATESPRAINSMAAFYMNRGEYEKANSYLEEQSQRLDKSSLLTARLLLQKVFVGVATEQDFALAGERLKYQEFDAQTVKGVRTIVETVVKRNNTDYAYYSLQLLDAMSSSPIYSQFPLFIRLQHYLRGQLFLYLKQPQAMQQEYSQAISRYNETDAALAMVAEVATAGYAIEAIKLLQQAEQVFIKQDTRKLKRSRASYQQDIDYLYSALNEAIEKAEQETP
ncbi:MAG: tetratricopeptide repeat protein [Gammaproteobacteria bacterium]|nr:tetratricopeptide repeat protein [Gammaproteobacteria bacterium]